MKWGFIGAVLAMTSVGEAAAPVVEYLYPAGGQRGMTVAVMAGGKFEPWPATAWVDHPGIRFKAGKEAGSFSVEIDKETSVGPHLVRLYNGEGASALRVFVVGEQTEVAEAEPNDEVGKAQQIAQMPVTIDGQLEKGGDADSYAVKLEAGQCLVASVMGRRLGSPMDPMLHLLDESGNVLAFAHDGWGLDPLMAHKAQKAGTYVVRISGFAYPPAAEVRLTGGKADVYRLSLTTGPFARFAWPGGVKSGEKGAVGLLGWNLGEAKIEVDARNAQDWIDVPAPGGEVLRVEVGQGAEMMEGGSVIEAPAAVTGRIGCEGEEDRVKVSVKNEEKLALAVTAGAAGSALDAVLRVQDGSGKELARDDDSGGGRDPRLEWTAPADGVYAIVVSDLNRQGGEDYVYRLEIGRPVAEVVGTTDAHEYRVQAGKSTAIKVNVARRGGHDAPLVAAAVGLPPGVSGSSVDVPEKGGEVTITLTASADAKPFSGAVRVMLLGTDAKRPLARAAVYDLNKDSRQEKDPGQELIVKTEAIWLTVLPPPATQPAEKEQKRP